MRYTTATSSPMQMKIELLAALAKGKPVLCFVFSTDKKLSAFGRNVQLAVEMLDSDQQKMVKIFVHGWGHDGPFLLEAIKCAKEGKTIDEAIEACEDVAQRTYSKVGFMDCDMFRKMKAWRPALFPDGFDIPEGHHMLSGPPSKIRPDGIAIEKRTQLMMAPIGMGSSREDAFEKAAKHIKDGLAPGQKLGNVMIPCVGRPDYGHLMVQKMEEAGIEFTEPPYVFNEGIIAVIMGSWGSIYIIYKVVEE
ncbi:unnamed protein product [Pseudo-nitzschia multistriata]|uniref:Uncharacterized protein n=1 Tax=Pseudo-nitzschia multistriata TaxID=183589 RepID=A0A448Z7T7_9STRA|nr:unnamed protein product [Pseudo-nitzschia multistriata]